MRKIDRFDKYMEISNLNDNKVTTDLGLSVGLIGKSRKEGRDLSDKVVEQILKKYRNLNRVWLLTGEGEMLTKLKDTCFYGGGSIVNDGESCNMIPMIPTAAQGGSLLEFSETVHEYDCERIVSPIKDAQFAMTISGDSMYPEYPSGAQILIKKIDASAFIDWGRVYVLDTCNGPVIKRLFPSEKENFVTCKSINPEFPPFEVNMDNVYAVYRVLLCMCAK